MLLEKESGLRVISLAVSNFMKVVACEVDAQGKHVIISGQNAAGKTSLLDSIFVALKGASALYAEVLAARCDCC